MATLFDVPSAPVDADTASLLALIDGDPIHARDRALVIEAVIETARHHGGLVDPNALRSWLHDEAGQSLVYPNVIGATVAALRHKGVLTDAGWVITKGSTTGNNGRPARAYRYVPAAPMAGRSGTPEPLGRGATSPSASATP